MWSNMEKLVRAFEDDADVRELMNLYFYKTVPEIFGTLVNI